MKTELRPYQREDVNKLLPFKAAGIFNEQRTGKTPTALTVFKERGLNKVIVVCPKSALYQWKDEYEKWMEKPCVVISGTPAKRLQQFQQWESGLIISYDTLKETKRSHSMLQEILKAKPEGIIADEAHKFKTPNTAIAKAMFKTSVIPNRLALTGTPAHGKPHEIFSILKWLYPNDFSSYWKFIEEFFMTYDRYNAKGIRYIEIGKFRLGKQAELQRFLNKYCVQRKRVEVMPWLPAKDYTQVRLPLTKEQTKYLSELKKYYETETVVTQGVLDRLVRYRQICNAPALLNLKGSSPKIDWVKDYIADNPDKPIIIFSKFTSFLKLLATELNCDNLLIGSTSVQRRNKLKLDFQSGKIKLLLINIDAGKEALTLDKAECIIFTDKYPPAGDIAQAEDRFVATSQDKADKPHQIIELMMAKSYDEQLYKLIKVNASATDVINDFKKYLQ